MLFKLILKSLWSEFKESFTVILALSIGLVGLSLVFSSRSAVESTMAAKAQEILSADLSLSARRMFSDSEKEQILELIKPNHHQSAYSLFTMASSKNGSKLTYIKAVERSYPFYGKLRDSKDQKLEFASTDSKPVLYGDQQLFDQLKVKEGDLVKVGTQNFLVKSQVTEDSTQGFRFSALAPKAYILKEDLSKTGLVEFGSTISETIYVKQPNPEDLLALKIKLETGIADTSIRVSTAAEAAQSSVRALRYLSDYLGLIALAGFLLASLGAGFVFFESLNKQLRIFSIFQSLGLTRRLSVFLLLLQIFALSFVASFLSLIVSAPLFALISQLLLNQFSIDAQFTLSPSLLSVVFFLAFSSSLLMSLPHFIALFKAPMRALLDFEQFQVLRSKSLPILFGVSLLFVFLVGTFLSRSLKISFFFTIGILVVFVLVGGLGSLILKFISRLPLKSWAKVALSEMNGKRVTQLILISVTSISILLVDAVNQIENSLQAQLNVSNQEEVPDYFLFDIQEEQIEDLEKKVTTEGLKLLSPSPMIRAKMLSINGQSYEVSSDESRFETREQEEEARFRNRGLNLSYRSDLQTGEKLIEGSPLSPHSSPDRLAELSVESDYARRVNLGVGDTVEMDVQGLRIVGRVKNLRRVAWTTFRPNFFVIIQPGVLESAPKTWLAGVSRGEPEETKNVLSLLDRDFPNVSYVDLDQVIMKVQEITGQMSQALLMTATLVLITGLFILLSTSRFHFLQSRKDLNLIKILGADSKFLMKKTLTEQFTLAGLCLFFGLGGSALLSAGIADRVFQTEFYWGYKTPALLFVGMLGIALFVSFLSLRWSQKTSPKEFLNS
ncbi:FtsX-like permease family protein [bacterium]|nr:FtsX-like permease family protein [bacterium]